MKILFIGGTGIISSACAALATQHGHELTLLNRGHSSKLPPPPQARVCAADVHAGPQALTAALNGETFDVVVDWVAFTPHDIERDLAAFSGRTAQFVFISSASAYQKPPTHYIITEQTPLENPFWDYSRNKIACEDRLMQAHHDHGFPVTIVRPSLTYGLSQIPLIYGSWQYPYTLIARMKRGEPVIVPGDGASLWTLTWNEDFAVGLLGLFGHPQAIGEAFHITSDEVLTWNQIFEETYRALGLPPNLVHIASDLIAAHDPRATGTLTGDKINSAVFDNSKIKRFVPHFRCATPWAQGVRRAIAWHESDPARQTPDPDADARWDAILTAYRRAFPQP